MKNKKFIQEVFKHSKKGSLHKELHIPLHEKIPESALEYIIKTPVGHHCSIYGHVIKVTAHMHKQASFLLTVDRLRRKK